MRSAEPVKRKTETTSSSLTSKHPVKSSPESVEESRLKAWKSTGVVSLRDSGLQVRSGKFINELEIYTIG